MRATLAAHAVTNMPEVVIVMGDIVAAATGDALVLGEAHEHFADFRPSQFLHSFLQNKRGPDTPDVRRVLSAFARQPPFSRRHRSPCGGPGGHSLQICAAMALGTQFRATARPCHRRSDWRWHEEAFALVFRPTPLYNRQRAGPFLRLWLSCRRPSPASRRLRHSAAHGCAPAAPRTLRRSR